MFLVEHWEAGRGVGLRGVWRGGVAFSWFEKMI